VGTGAAELIERRLQDQLVVNESLFQKKGLFLRDSFLKLLTSFAHFSKMQ
jgi:hypothetical protein